ncbi:hypothetical protein ACUL41_01765 [Virgibacillus natechei]|uniref:hypothetical protein n=1 Tax=Virgibacillus sp. CBA3643 TaxID=2942278 RepID=UPI0035A3CAF7
MDEQILNLLTELNSEMKSMKSDMKSMKAEMNQRFEKVDQSFERVNQQFKEVHHRFDKVDAKLEGAAWQFKATNEPRINERDFILDKVNKMEKEIYILKNNN